MLSIRFASFVVALLLPMAAGAITSDLRVIDAKLSADYETLTVTLSEAPQRATVWYSLYMNDSGYDFNSGQAEFQNKSRMSLGGFREHIVKQGGTGKGTLEVRACLQNPRTTDTVTTACSEPFIIEINAGATGGSFSDVPASHAYADAIRYVHQQGIVSGNPDGTFQPDLPITRAAFAKIITLSLFSQTMINQCGSNYFTDVPHNEWYRPYLCRARDAGLLNGYPDKTFRPGMYINFAESAKIFSTAFDLVRVATCNNKPCPDVSTPGHPWYEQYAQALDGQNAIPLSIKSPSHLLTRGEMAEIIYRLRARITNKPSQMYGALTGTTTATPMRTMRMRDYAFEYPPEWIPVRNEERERFDFTVDGRILAAVECPVGGMGFEAWDFQQWHRSYAKSGKRYRVDYWFGTPEARSNLGHRALIFMSPDDGSGLPEGPDSCFIEAATNEYMTRTELEGTFRKIYDSVRAR